MKRVIIESQVGETLLGSLCIRGYTTSLTQPRELIVKEMVMRFMPDGSIQHTLKDTFFDPSKELGATRKIDRMTDIKYDEERQKFYVEFLRGDDNGRPLVGATIGVLEGFLFYKHDNQDTAYYNTYEAAVEAEIELVNRLRYDGVTF